MHIDPSARILIPGVGLSELPRRLFDAGFKILTLYDVEEAALDHQKQSFQDVDPGSRPHMEMVDLIEPPIVRANYDVVLDKSVMDVLIIRQTNAKAVLRHYEHVLDPGGLLICFSMFHRKWKRCALLPAESWLVKYASISKIRYSRTRPSIPRSVENVAVLVAMRNLPEN